MNFEKYTPFFKQEVTELCCAQIPKGPVYRIRLCLVVVKSIFSIKFDYKSISRYLYLRMNQYDETEIVGQYGIKLSIIEVGLGSILHGLHVPMAGFFLSLNQGFVLCRCVKLTKNGHIILWLPYAISNIAAAMKTLSPVGKKFGPMLSLSMQGLLFNLGTLFFGRNLLGTTIGIALLSLWTFLQPLVTYYLFFGQKLLNAVEYFYQKTLPYHSLTKEKLWLIALAFILGKLLVAICLACLAHFSKSTSIYSSTFQLKINEIYEKQNKLQINTISSSKNIWLLSLRDLLNPFFLISFGLTVLFLFITSPRNVELVWSILRPLVLGYLFFTFSRSKLLDVFIRKCENGRFDLFARSLRFSLSKMRKKAKMNSDRF